ncbi:MAG: hypothetical protein MZW92_57595 [Comamonadaceae bacterium]|nr:hypothetical protein [Comamonadaceae bacterium]
MRSARRGLAACSRTEPAPGDRAAQPSPRGAQQRRRGTKLAKVRTSASTSTAWCRAPGSPIDARLRDWPSASRATTCRC